MCYFKGRSLRCSPGRGNAGHCAVTLYVGEGLSGSNGARLTLLGISIFHSDTHNQTGPLWCWFPSKWACAHARPLWVSPTTSPMRLGVFPAAAPTPRGAFNQRFEALFPRAGALGCAAVCFSARRSSGLSVGECGAAMCYPALPAPLSATLSPVLWVYLCKCGTAGSASARTACAICPSLRQSQSRHSHASPLHPSAVSAPPTSVDECLFSISLVSVPLAVQFSVSSGCARRRSVSTYAAILVPLYRNIF